jgi:hypothetical protein
MSKSLSIIVNIDKNDQEGFIKLLEFTKENNMNFISFGHSNYVSDYISDNNEEYSDNMINKLIKNKLLNGQNVNKQILTKIFMICNELEDRISELETEIEDAGDDDEILQDDMNGFMEQLQMFQDFLTKNENKHSKK